MENYNIELLNETYNRIANVLEKNSNLKIYIGGDVNDINSNFTEICISKQNHFSSLKFKTSIKSTESFNSIEYNKYSFLLHHKDNDYDNYIGHSIFNFAKRCRNYYNKYSVYDYPTIAYELYSSEAGRIIKELGFPSCLEELAMKMGLMGI
jgi:hypothetical protein